MLNQYVTLYSLFHNFKKQEQIMHIVLEHAFYLLIYKGAFFHVVYFPKHDIKWLLSTYKCTLFI